MTWLMTKSCWNWLKWKFVNFCPASFPGRRHLIVRGSALKALEGDGTAGLPELAGFLDLYRNDSV
ncbi:hypothetical protein ACLB1M_26365 [Escherichia coli]